MMQTLVSNGKKLYLYLTSRRHGCICNVMLFIWSLSVVRLFWNVLTTVLVLPFPFIMSSCHSMPLLLLHNLFTQFSDLFSSKGSCWHMNYGFGQCSTLFRSPLDIVLPCIYWYEVQIRIKHDRDPDFLLQSLMKCLLTADLRSFCVVRL